MRLVLRTSVVPIIAIAFRRPAFGASPTSSVDEPSCVCVSDLIHHQTDRRFTFVIACTPSSSCAPIIVLLSNARKQQQVSRALTSDFSFEQKSECHYDITTTIHGVEERVAG